jgi:hypothetical protein
MDRNKIKNSIHFIPSLACGLLAVTSMIACTPSTKEIVHEQTVVSPSQTPGASTSSQNQGGVDAGGGGNESHGRPLESYTADIQKNEDIAPVLNVINNLAKTAPQVAADLYHILVDRQWYMVPFSLTTIPSERLGVAFDTEQVAIQNLGEVWVDSASLMAMNKPDRSILLLHETVMGLYFMRYQSAYDECLSTAAAIIVTDSSAKSAYATARKTCAHQVLPTLSDSSDGILPSIIKNPSSIDYINIRAIVATLWKDQGNEDGEDLIANLKSKGLREYKRIK